MRGIALQWGRGFSSADTVGARLENLNSARLQWGRGFSSADTSGRGQDVRWRRRFNGAADFHPRIQGGQPPPWWTNLLQWGRGFSSADTPLGGRVAQDKGASMGPRIFIRGYMRTDENDNGTMALQWGRGFSSADTGSLITHLLSTSYEAIFEHDHSNDCF